ncbi:MAG: Exodeoxyribonuclease 7 small subunit [Ignavibacteria bacterium]|nr:Exodeoxyribonuclease 7 small subunit [Ignavibacteria bacterium]
MAKKKETVENPVSNFRKSFKRLEEILDKLENEVEDESLEEIVKNYKEGLTLLKECRKMLAEAELQIEKISTEDKN